MHTALTWLAIGFAFLSAVLTAGSMTGAYLSHSSYRKHLEREQNRESVQRYFQQACARDMRNDTFGTHKYCTIVSTNYHISSPKWESYVGAAFSSLFLLSGLGFGVGAARTPRGIARLAGSEPRPGCA